MYHRTNLYLNSLHEFLKYQKHPEEDKQAYRSQRYNKLRIMAHPESRHKRFNQSYCYRQQELHGKKRCD